MSVIKAIKAREIIDGRGLPTVEVRMWLDDGRSVVSSAASGTTIGKYEAVNLRDQDYNRMLGMGVLKAVANINNIIAPKLIGLNPIQQTQIDQTMVDLDGTLKKKNLGANAVLAVSQATMKAGALSVNYPLYYYVQQKYNLTQSLFIPSSIYGIINGGRHGADNLDLQEFQIIPASHIDYLDSLHISVTMQKKLEDVLIEKGAIHSIGLVGGFTPNLYSNIDVFEILVETIKTTNYTFAQDIFFGIDAAASNLFNNGKYYLKDNAKPYSASALLDYYKEMREHYQIIYIEDPFEEDDVNSWQKITKELGNTTKIGADNLVVSNREKLLAAIQQQSCNTVVVKLSQIGTISEAVQVIKIAKDANLNTIISHRSGETNDTFIADFAVGVGSEYTKFGPTNRGERVAKYNRLLEIYQQLKQNNQ